MSSNTSQNQQRTLIGATRQLSSENNKAILQGSQPKIVVNSGTTEPVQTQEPENNNGSMNQVRGSRLYPDTDPAIIKAKEMSALFKKKEHYFKLTNFSSPTFCKWCKGIVLWNQFLIL